jgi:hypothetical protein
MTDDPITTERSARRGTADPTRGRGGRRGRNPGPSQGTLLDRFLALSSAARWGIGVPALTLLVVIAVVGGDVAVSFGRVHPGVSVAGLKLGSLTEEEAARKLATELGKRMSSPVTARLKDKTWKVDAGRLGLTLDATETAGQAMLVGREARFATAVARRFAAVFGGVEVPARLESDAAEVSALLDEMDKTVAVPARDADVKLQGLTPVLSRHSCPTAARSTSRWGACRSA